MRHRRFLPVFLLLIVAAVAAAGTGRSEPKPDPRKLETSDIDVEASLIPSFSRLNSSATTFGKLTFLGGLSLKSPGTKTFGGWSGLVLDDGAQKLFAVSDSGVWMTGELTYKDGRLSGLSGARLGPILALDGNPLKRNKDRDAEAAALVSGTLDKGTVLVAFEQKNRIARYDLSRAGLSPAKSFVEMPDGIRRMRRNGGFEAMTVIKGGPHAGSVIALAERLYNSSREHTGWIWVGGRAQQFNIANIGDFDVTDIASDHDGTLYLLERRFRWLEGIKMRVRRFQPQDIAPGKAAEGDILIEANLESYIDNMEGLAVSTGAKGETILTMISDDNFNRFLQSTLVLQFAINAGKTAKAQPSRPGF